MINTYMIYTLYKYDEWHELLYDNDTFTCACNLTDSRPMHDRLVKIHKGVDNEVKFRVYDSDRKRYRLDQFRVSVILINKENHELVLKTKGRMMTERGTFKVLFREGDIINLAPGFYDMVVTGEEWATPEQPGEIISTPFYTDTMSNMRLVAEITTQGQKDPIPTIEISSNNKKTGLSDWIMKTETVDGVNTRVYHSSPLPANRIRNHINGVHTFTVLCNEFTGRLYIKGSLEHIPPTEPEKYFPLNVSTFSDYIQYGIMDDETELYQPFTGIDPYSIETNVVWIMFVWIPTESNGIPVDTGLIPPDWELPVKRVQLRS